MPVLCLGPVCIPLNLLLPFLLGIAHRYGLLRWIKREWVTFTYWKQRFTRRSDSSRASQASHLQTTSSSQSSNSQSSNSQLELGAGGGNKQFVCDGDVCKLVPSTDESSQQQQQRGQALQVMDSAEGKPAVVSTARSRKGAREPAA